MNTNTYSLSNTTYSEVALSLPLPNLPICFGANSEELALFEDGDGRAAKRSAVLAQAGKIAELLKSTDISYLSLREEVRNGKASISAEPGSVLSAVLQHDFEAFDYSTPGLVKERGFRNLSSEKRSSAQNIHGGILSQSVSKGASTNIPEGVTSDVQEPMPLRKSRIRRKEASRDVADDSKSGVTDLQDGGIEGLCELLDSHFERTEMPGENEGEEEGALLPLSEIKILSNEIMAAHSKNTLHLVPVDSIVRLLNLLDRHIQHARDIAVDEEDDVDSDNFCIVMSALESVHIALAIMTHRHMPKQVYNEEIIDRIINFSRQQILKAYDPSYRMIHKGRDPDVYRVDEDDDDDDTEYGPGKKSRRKTKVLNRKLNPLNRVSGSVSSMLQKLCSILGLLKELLLIERLLDSSVLQLIKTSIATFAIDNIQLLQLKAIGVVCAIFSSYVQHRTIIMDEIFQLLWKLPSSKRSLRAYHLPDEDQKQIQMITALLIQVVQCSVALPELRETASAEPDTAEHSNSPAKCFEPAAEACMHFWGTVLQRWNSPKAQDGSDIKGVVENLVVDLLTTLNIPEYPAAGLLLQVLCLLLFGSVGLKCKDAVVRGMAIDLLGQIAARLKHDAVACSNEKFWILQELVEDKSEVSGMQKQKCAICLEGKAAKFMIHCDGCKRSFHGECIGVTGLDMLGRGWLCHCCLCRKQLSMLSSNSKGAVKNKEGNPKNSTRQTAEVSPQISGFDVLQQILLNYLQEAGSTDDTSTFARRFYLCQWYRDDPNATQLLPYYHGRWTSKAPVQDFGVAPLPLSRNAITKISAALGQQRSLARGFDKILDILLASLQENSPTPRAKALRAVSAIVEADPGVLGDKRVKSAVEGRFLDSAISVREAAMELVGRHIASHPDVAVQYFDKVSERIMDTGVSVRKRVVKIIRDMCMSKCEFKQAANACVRMISRINDEETSIQDLVCRTFYELWFEESSDTQTQNVGDGSSIPLEIAERTEQLVDVLRRLHTHQALVTIIKRSLALDFCPQTAKSIGTNAVQQAIVRKHCELMCQCLLERILQAEETNSEESEVRALPYVLALHAFCMVDPTLCSPSSDPSRFVITLQPYLKTQADNRDVAQLLQSILFVIDTVLPLLRRPPQNFVEELERDLKQMIVRYSFLTVVHACIKCLCSLGKVLIDGVKSFEYLVRRFYKHLEIYKARFEPKDKLNVLRCLFCLGLLVRYGANMIPNNSEVNIVQILSLYKHYLCSDDFNIKVRSLQALGFFFIARPEFMMEKDIGRILEAALSSGADTHIKIQALRNLYDYLVDIEEQMGIDDSGKSNKHGNQPEVGRAVPVAAGAGDSNICGGIIQLHWNNILNRCLDLIDQVRQSALKLVEIVLRQGLVHPITCVPYLIALEVDQQESNSKLAHRLLTHMNEKYPSFFESRLGDGLQLSFQFIQSGAFSSIQAPNSSKGSANIKIKHDGSTSAAAKVGVSRIYKLIRSSRISRNKFLSSVIRKFDFGNWSYSPLPFLMYCAEVLASLPFTLPDEPLYLVYAINRIMQVRAGSLESDMKALISNSPLGALVKVTIETKEAEKDKEGGEEYNIECIETINNSSVDEDDTQGIPDVYIQKLKGDCYGAITLALLLKLKRHLKIVYSLNDARCQAFSPSEPIKSGEAFSKQNIPFSIKETPIEVPKTVSKMLAQYQEFKRLLKEDSIDYSTYTAQIPKKRPRAVASQTDTTKGVQTNGHLPARSLRAKIVTPSRRINRAGSGESENEDDDYDDEDWAARGQKHRRFSNGGRGKGRKQSL
ncbi:sister chromatid cohesion protein SCC2 isoform X1 [Cryptomeria japonica]|uniref:sister chromatid cohesion protein SCC2 isoform X1 n=1 Tax=Cryptomeria japonica TaxID=3369 RepID=UPI0027D9FDA2|nr:sister chromatid cohesion protein SCC2 isoform X1 [Cryptomeria japonica]